jgi:uncharacterized repeat protein (TIGR02543 family)
LTLLASAAFGGCMGGSLFHPEESASGKDTPGEACYTVTFNSNGGSTPYLASKVVTYGGVYGDLPGTGRSGCSFTGWYTAASGGAKITSSTVVSTASDHTLYAHWEGKRYTVTFNANNGTTPSPAAITVVYGSPYGALASTSRKGTAYMAGASLTSDLTTTGGETVTLYAQWNYTPAIGSTGPAGGIVFYDKGNNLSGWRYMEAAPEDLGYYQWGGYGLVAMYGASFNCITTLTGIGYGTIVTEGLVSHYHEDSSLVKGHPAAKACADYTYGGYDDWFLPTGGELNELYKQKTTVGGFSVYEYWPSSGYDGYYAYFQNFSNGGCGLAQKNTSQRVRAVRRF